MPDITITNEWRSVSTLSGIAVGVEMKIQNKGNYDFLSQESITQPANSNNEGELVTTLEKEEPSKIFTAGSGEIWVKSTSLYNTIAFVQDLT